MGECVAHALQPGAMERGDSHCQLELTQRSTSKRTQGWGLRSLTARLVPGYAGLCTALLTCIVYNDRQTRLGSCDAVRKRADRLQVSQVQLLAVAASREIHAIKITFCSMASFHRPESIKVHLPVSSAAGVSLPFSPLRLWRK